MNDNERTNKVLIGFLCGAAVGAGIALLTAPASGEETRKRIGTTARKVADTTRDRFNRVRGQFGEMGHELSDSVAHGIEEMRASQK